MTLSLPALLIADDHTMVRTGLLLAMQLDLGVQRIHEATSCAEVMSQLRAVRPTHLITDIIFKDGNALEILPTIVKTYPDLSIMVYSMMPEEIYLPALSRYHITRYVNKNATQEEYTLAFRTFLFQAPGHERAAAGATGNPFSRLSPREHEVLHYLLQGETITTIAMVLNLHKNTVSTLKNRILEKTALRNMKEVSDAATLHNLIV